MGVEKGKYYFFSASVFIYDSFHEEIIVPLFLEQLLVMLVGIADTHVVSYAGEAFMNL